MLTCYVTEKIERNQNFVIGLFAEPPKTSFATEKTDVKYIDAAWSIDLLDLNDYGPKTNFKKVYFSSNQKFLQFMLGFSIWKNAQTMKNSFEDIIKTSKRKPNSIETVDGKDIVNNFFYWFLEKI